MNQESKRIEQLAKLLLAQQQVSRRHKAATYTLSEQEQQYLDQIIVRDIIDMTRRQLAPDNNLLGEKLAQQHKYLFKKGTMIEYSLLEPIDIQLTPTIATLLYEDHALKTFDGPRINALYTRLAKRVLHATLDYERAQRTNDKKSTSTTSKALLLI